jgi:polygalacturonase
MHPLPPLVLAAFLSAAAVTSAVAADVSPAQPVIPHQSFNLLDYGAKGDGTTVNTGAFARAVAAVERAGGGTLEVPPGVYFTGPFDLGSNLNFHLDAGATVLFSPRFDDYRRAGAKGYRPMIAIDGAHDVLISGSGTINGHGEAWWPEAARYKAAADARHARSNTSPRPAMVAFLRCRRIRVEGVTLTHSAVFNLLEVDCQDVTVDGVTILNPPDSLNTDGIDPKNDQRVLITHCRIDTGDDCVALGAGAGPVERDVLVTDCTFLHGHGCSIGSGTQGGVRDVVVRNCTFDGTDGGVRLKSARDRGGLVENVTYEDLTMRHVGVAVSISSTYDNTPIDRNLSKGPPQPVTPLTPRWRNIVVRNVTATACRMRAGLIAGLPEMPAEDITLDHVAISAPLGLRITNARDVTLRDVRLTIAQGPGLITDDSVQDLKRTE